MPSPEKDPRIYFALERTLLAWIRTGLALMGFGFVVARFGLFLREFGLAPGHAPVQSSAFSLWAGTGLILLGVVVNVISTLEYRRTNGELSEGRYVTGRQSSLGVALAMLLCATGLALAGYLVVMR